MTDVKLPIADSVRARVFAAADQLFAADSAKVPRISDVRALAKCSTNEANDLMKVWKAEKLRASKGAAAVVPEKIMEVFTPALGLAWQMAQDMAAEGLHALQLEYKESTEELNEQLSELSLAVDDAEKQADQYKASHEASLEQVAQLTEQLAQAQRNITELNEVRQQLQYQLKSAGEAHKQLEQENTTLNNTVKQHLATIESHQSAAEALRIEVARLTERHAALQENASTIRAQHKVDQEQLQAKLKETTAQLTLEQMKSAETAGRNNELVLQVTVLQEQLTDIRNTTLTGAERSGFMAALAEDAIEKNPHNQDKEPQLFLQWIKGFAEGRLSVHATSK